MWTVITAGVAAARDHPGSFERPMDEHYVVKRGRPGAETLLTESGNLGMPLIETSLPPEPEAIGDLVPTVMDDAARAAAEQALSVLLSELTSGPEVKTSLAGVAVEATPYYAALTQSRPASAASSRPTSPPDNTLGAPLADASPITAAVGEAADAKVITAAMDIPAAELDLSAELQSADAETAAGASDEYETTGVETAELSEMEAADTPPAVAPPLSTEKRASMLSEPFVEALMETTLEEALYNLMSEAIDGEFNLSVLPRQIVQNVRQEELPSTADVSTAL
jgi:hypothetical protein